MCRPSQTPHLVLSPTRVAGAVDGRLREGIRAGRSVGRPRPGPGPCPRAPAFPPTSFFPAARAPRPARGEGAGGDPPALPSGEPGRRPCRRAIGREDARRSGTGVPRDAGRADSRDGPFSLDLGPALRGRLRSQKAGEGLSPNPAPIG